MPRGAARFRSFHARLFACCSPRDGRKVGNPRIQWIAGFHSVPRHGYLTEPCHMACVGEIGGHMRCLTLREAARETGISYKTMLEAVRGGELKAFIPCGLSRKRFVRDNEVERWLKAMEKASRRESWQTDETP